MAMGGGMAVLPSTAEAGRKLLVQLLLKVMAYQKLHQLQLRIHLHLLNLVAPLVFHYR